MRRKMKHLFCITILMFALITISNCSYGQSALSQLESAAGQKAGSVYVPKVSGPVPVSSSSISSSSSSSSSGSNTVKSTSSSFANTITNELIQGVISDLLSSDPEKEKAALEAKKKEQERIAAEEQHKKMSLEEWRKFQTEEEMKRQMERDTKTKQGKDLLPQLQTFGNGSDLKPFSIEDPNQTATPINLKSKPGIIKMFTTEEEQKKRDDWMQKNGFDDLVQINSDNVIDGSGNQPAEKTWGEAALRTAIGEAPGLAGVIGSGMLNVVDNTFGGIKNVVNEFTSGNDAQALENANKLPGNIVVNSVKTTASDWASDKITEISYCPLLKTVSGATELHKYVKLGYTVWENKQGK
jgi:hypothetical protein